MAKGAELPDKDVKRLQQALKADDANTVRAFLDGGLGVNARFKVDGEPFSLLHEAALRGAPEIVRLLLDRGADVDRKVGGGTPLLDACLACSQNPKKRQVAEMLLAAGADPNATSGSDEGDSRLTALMYAAESGSLEVIRLLLASAADPKLLTRQGRSAINFALERMLEKEKPLDMVQMLIEAGCPPAGSCLVRPVGEGNLEVVRCLIAAGADVNARTNKFDDFRRHGPGSSLVDLALQYAINSEMMKEFSSYDPTARARYVQILRELVQAGADVNQPTSKVPPLTLAAAYGGDAEMVRLLLELGADPKAHADIRLATALHAAAAYGHTEIARVLLDAGADVNALAPQNKTPLDEAIQNERVGVAELLRHAGGREGVAGEHPSLSSVSANLLAAARTGDVADVREALQAGADVNAKDDVAYRQLEAGTPDTEVTGGKPAVLLATERGELPMVQELLSAGADPNTFSTCTMFYPGRTALHAAAERGDLAVVEAIIRAGGDVNAKELGESETWVEMPLHLAAERGHIEVVRALLAAKAKVDGKTNRGTALHAATRGGQVEVLRLLLQAGAKLEISAKLEGTPLMTAGTEGYPEIARLLLEAGADVHAEAHGQTPLHIVVYAVWWRSDWKEEKRRSAEMIETIRLLIKHGADVNARDREGQTPMDMAEQYELKEVIALLTAAGAKRATDLEAGPQHGAAADREKPARKPNR